MTKKYYPEIDSNPDFPAIEEKILSFWQEQKVFEASVDNRDKNNEFVFYDGPPFANGLPHYGHLLTGFVKDLFPRYQTMKGKRVERRFGWDCHGLPAEMGAEKELGISGSQAIKKFGIDNFNNYCRTSVMKYTSEWEDYVTRQARWVDFQNDYKTMDTSFMESTIWAFKQLYDKGLVYEAYRVMPYSWAAETPLSNFETRLDNSYRDREDKAVTVAFELLDRPEGAPEADKYYLLAWTTTPWTLPSNLALAVSEKMEYAAVLKDGSCYVATQSFFDSNVNIFGVLDAGKPNVYELTPQAKFAGNNLIGLRYKPLFPYFKDQPNAFRVLAGDFIEEGSGTGVVHMAPGFGEDDMRVCVEAGIEVVCPVDQSGRFTDAIYDLYYNSGATQKNPPLPLRERVGERGYSESILDNAKDLRSNMTDVEAVLWRYLRANRFENYKFRRQQPIGNYIVDFFCASAGLVIELDGGQHDEQRAYDEKRTKFLENQGYRILRFWNNEMVENIDGVLDAIYRALGENPSPQPSPSRGEGVMECVATLSLKGLNVIAEKTKAENEPYKQDQLDKFGLVNLRIIDWLKQNGSLIKNDTIKHSYPHCWRTDQPLIYRAMPSWYVEVTKFKDRMVELNQQINWIPGHVKDGLFGKWLENARDWSISRNRFWGTPIPVWRSKSGKIKVFGSIAELEKASGKKITDLHRPYIDEVVINEGGEEYRRVEDVFDCWFESGSMPYGQVHYPFERGEWFRDHNPADFIVEYAAQTRGWFYTLMVLGVALFDKPPFLNCICHGTVLDDKGQKLSKRLNNYADPRELFKKYGADALRWFMMASPVMRGLELYIDKEGLFIRDAVRLYIKPLWNAYNFFALYANADGIEGRLLAGDKAANPMDAYILAKLKIMVEATEKSLDGYDTPAACQAISEFLEVLNNWYIRRSKERFWKSEKDADKQAAYDTLYTVLHVLSRAVAPLLPMVAEEIYSGLVNGGKKDVKHSVHLADWPDVLSIGADVAEAKEMDWVRDVCNAALAIRNNTNIRVRQPLQRLEIITNGNGIETITSQKNWAIYASIIRDEVNVKYIESSENDVESYAELKLSVNSAVLGKRLPAKMKQIIPASKSGQWKKLDDGKIWIADEVLKDDEFVLQLIPKEKYKNCAQALLTNDALVVLDINITPELEAEGIARDLVRMVQEARKSAKLNVTDRISLSLGLPDKLASAIKSHQQYLMEQVLADSVNYGEISAGYNIAQTLDGVEIKIGISLAEGFLNATRKIS